MMPKQTGAGIIADGLSDWILKSFTWSLDGNDLELELLPPGCDSGSQVSGTRSKALRLRFAWSRKLRVNLDFGGYMGAPLLFRSQAEDVGNNSWLVRFEFGAAPEGFIEFYCDAITLM
jgi:hypothetical protein